MKLAIRNAYNATSRMLVGEFNQRSAKHQRSPCCVVLLLCQGMGDVAKYSGSTAVTCIVWQDEKTKEVQLASIMCIAKFATILQATLYTANLGDSRAILVY